MHIVTIVARNFLPRAAVLARTCREHNPHDPVSVLVVDAEPGELPDHADYSVVTPADLLLDVPEFDRMALIYDVTELCTALKPWALELLLERGAEVATYLDPDIAVYAPLEDIEKLSLEHGIVLTPHTVEPIPRDGLSPTEADIMAAGTFNLGFLAVDQGSRGMLSWWQERLLRDCIAAPHEMLFVDQRWIDLVPGYFRHVVLDDPTYNVAYWNLDSRPLVRVADEVHVAERGPLHFFHFSGYEPARPWVLTKYHVEQPRVVLSEHPVVAQLCHEYAGWITDPALGGGPGRATVDLPYRFDRLPDGTRITPAMRSAVRRALVGSDQSGVGHPPGWRDNDAVRDWFRAPVRPGCPTNRYLLALWESRVDLQAAFPAPQGGDGPAFVDWAWTWASRDPNVVVDLLPAVDQAAAPDVERQPGVNVAGYFAAEMGVGEMGRMLVDGVRAAGVPHSTVLNTATLSRQDHRFEGSGGQTLHSMTIAAVNADQFTSWARVSDPALRLGYTVGMWAWEVEEFSGYDDALALVDEVWTISSFARDAIARATDKPVHVIPLPIREPAPTQPLDRAALGIPDGPYVLFTFDYFSVFERKNPMGVVAAFRRAFPDADGPTLVLKSINGHRCRSDRERLRMAVAGRPDMVLVEDYVDHAQVGALIEGCLAYISLHRAEGYGLTMGEAMARGRPVIATAYSGNLDFMDETTALLVPYLLVPVAPGSGPYSPRTVWAEPDEEAAAAHLRWVVDNPTAADDLGRRAARAVRATASIEQTAAFIRGRVDEVQNRPTPSRDQLSRAERAIRQTRRAVRQPAVGRRNGWLRGYDERQQTRFLEVLKVLGLVRRRADRALRTSRKNRSALRQLTGQVDRVATRVATSESDARLAGAQLNGVDERLHGLDERLTRTSQELGRLGDYVREFSGDVEGSVEHARRQLAELYEKDLTAALAELRDDVRRLDAEQTARPYASDGLGLRRTDESGVSHLGYADPAEVPAFADLFRGSQEFLLDRMRVYVPLLRAHGPVLDLGCGRGELLLVLAEAGVPARGVDQDEAAVAAARGHGVDASVADGLDEVARAAPASLGAVVSTQVAEHLTSPDLNRLFKDAKRALRPGGVLMVETVNPHSPAALKTFWIDLTHRRPLYPEALLVLAKACGFGSARIDFPFGTGELDHDLRTCGEYTLVAYT